MSRQNELFRGTVRAGVDYLTLTCQQGAIRDDLHDNAVLEMFQELEPYVGPIGEKNDGGFYGVGNPHCHFGFKGDWAMVEVRGPGADIACEKLKKWDLPFRCTRIDLQVTADYGKFDPAQIDRWCKKINKNETNGSKTRRRKKAVYEEDGARKGLTCGSRTSEGYIRIYHPRTKHGESFNESDWRFEFEYKGARAKGVWERIKPVQVQAELAEAAVVYQMQKAGLREWWFEGVSPERVTGIYRETSFEKTYNWLTSTVSPAIIRAGVSEDEKRLLRAWAAGILGELD